MVGTLSQSDYRWGPSANQITGARTGVACAGVVGTLSQSDYTEVVHAGVACAGVACAGVVGTLSQSDYTGVVRKGGGDTQPIRLHRGCACRGGGDT